MSKSDRGAYNQYSGVTTLDYFAIRAMQTLIHKFVAITDNDKIWVMIAEASYKMARAMMKESEKE